MVQEVQDALVKRGVTDNVIAVGEFNPRGHTGALFAGGLAGSELDRAREPSGEHRHGGRLGRRDART